jgi:hypothetical protein
MVAVELDLTLVVMIVSDDSSDQLNPDEVDRPGLTAGRITCAR